MHITKITLERLNIKGKWAWDFKICFNVPIRTVFGRMSLANHTAGRVDNYWILAILKGFFHAFRVAKAEGKLTIEQRVGRLVDSWEPPKR